MNLCCRIICLCAMALSACATAPDQEFLQPLEHEHPQMRWMISTEGGGTLTGMEARDVIFEQHGLERNESPVSAPTGALEVIHYRQNDPERPLIVFCGSAGAEMGRLGDTVAFLNQSLGDMLLWNYPGYGDSEGAPTGDNLSRAGSALIKAVGAFKRKPEQPVVFWGHSLGGFVCAEMAAQSRNTSALLLETTAPTTQQAALAAGARALKALFRADLDSTTRNFSVRESLKGSDFPILIFGAALDQVLPVRLSQALVEDLREDGHAVTYVEYPIADHFSVSLQPNFKEDVSRFLRPEPDQ